MDLAVAALDLIKAGTIIANMIESYLAGGAPLPNMEGADHDESEDGRSPSGAASLHLHSPIDAGPGPGPLQPPFKGTHHAIIVARRHTGFPVVHPAPVVFSHLLRW